MTTKQATQIGKGLLPDLPGFVAEGRLMFKSPVGDFLYGLYIENTSDANCFHFHAFFLPLFVPQEEVSFTYGDRIGNALNWRLDNPNLSADLRAAIHGAAMPFFNNVSTLAGAIGYLKERIESGRPRVNSHVLEALAYALIKLGDYSSALRALAEQQQLLEKATIPWVLALKARAELIEEKLLQNPDVALAQLEAWKTESISKLSLEKY